MMFRNLIENASTTGSTTFGQYGNKTKWIIRISTTDSSGTVWVSEGVRKEFEEGAVAAYFSPTTNNPSYSVENRETGETCYYSERQVFPENRRYRDSGKGPAEKFTCTLSYNKHEGYESDREQFCNQGVSTRSGPVPAVEYYTPKEAMPLGTSKYVDSNGFNNNFMQTLRDAEAKFFTTYLTDDNFETVTPDGVQKPSNGYNYPDDVMESWVYTNGSNKHPKVGEPSFEGGFAPKCKTGLNWDILTSTGSKDNWGCSGTETVDWRQEVFFPDLTVDDDLSTLETAGFFIMPYNFKDSTPFLNNLGSYKEEVGGEASLEKLNALCWAGSQDDKPSDLSSDPDNMWFAVEIDSLNTGVSNPVPVTGQLNLTDNLDEKYSCQWKFKDSEGNDIDNVGETDKLESGAWNKVYGERGFNASEVSNPGIILKDRPDVSEEENPVKQLSEEWKDGSCSPSNCYRRGVTISWFTS